MAVNLFYPLSFFFSKVNASFLWVMGEQVVSFASFPFHQALFSLEELSLCLYRSFLCFCEN